MYKKVYEKVKSFIKEFKVEFIILSIFCLINIIPLPVIIYGDGGIELVNKKLEITDKYESKGNIYTSYVSEYKPTVFSYIIGKIKKFDIEKKSNDLTYNQENDYSKVKFEEAINNSIYVGYKLAGKDIRITKHYLCVNYILPQAKTNLKINDRIIKVNNKTINSIDDLKNIKNLKENDKVNIEVINNNKTYTRYAYIINYENNLIFGFSYSDMYEYNYDNYKISNDGLGPSGGLMTSLYIYDSLTKYDLTKGRNIAGTGTIEIDGKVGAIGGIKWKVLGASKNNVDVFFSPKENYEEAIKTKKEYNLDINIIEVDNIEDAIDYLKK